MTYEAGHLTEQFLSLSFRLNALASNPVVKIRVRKPNSGTSELYEWNTSFLNETSNKSLGTTQLDRCSSDV
jgi:hypothetical protein